jgi:cysteine desulfurase
MTERAYLDWNATARVRPEAREAVMAVLQAVGNPSSVHGAGRAARQVVEQAREQVAALVGAMPREVVFTSGGTEANSLALTPALGDVMLISAIEHPSVHTGGRFAQVEEIPVTVDGVVDLNALEQRLAEVSRPLVSIMLANNETGVVQPVAQAAKLVHAAGGILHVDAVQGPGRTACDFKALDADMMTLSAHKLGGPQGVGALVRREALDLPAQIRGGGQERGARAGTENVPGIAGFGAAAAAVSRSGQDEAARIAALRERLEAGLKAIAPQAVIFGERASRLPNTTLFAVSGVKAETAVIALDLEGVAVSSGAACSSGKVTPSHVLAAMAVSAELASGAVRLSLGYSTTQAEIDAFLKAWAKLAESLYKSRKLKDIAA